jgi:hypothetical protein
MFKIDRALLRQSYASALEKTGRLTTYALADGLVNAEDEVAERCRQLAVDDLILLSISLRRLIEATSLQAKARNTWVSTLRFADDGYETRASRVGQMSLWTLLGIVVHSRMLQVQDQQLLLAMWCSRKALDVAAQRMRDKPRRIDPVCFVKSDTKSAAFLISECAARASQILESVRAACAAEGIHLDLEWLD